MPEKTFKIGTVAKMTGISTHALRVWEKRYDLAPPLRSTAGGRLYTQEQVTKLAVIKRLLDEGHAISQIAHLSTDELAGMARPRGAPRSRFDEPVVAAVTVDQFLAAVSELNLFMADRILGHAALTLEPRQLIDEVLVPIFARIGESWAKGELSVAKEHAASAVLRNQLAQLMRLFATDAGMGPVVTATLSGELHEFGALLAALTAALAGFRVVHLGADLPTHEIALAAENCAAEVVMISLVYQDPLTELPALRKMIPRRVALVAGGHGASRIKVRGVEVISTLAALEAWLEQRAHLSRS